MLHHPTLCDILSNIIILTVEHLREANNKTNSAIIIYSTVIKWLFQIKNPIDISFVRETAMERKQIIIQDDPKFENRIFNF